VARYIHLAFRRSSELHNPGAAQCLPSRPMSQQRLCGVSKGFTLLELLVVIVIIGLLAAYVGPKYFAQLGKSEVTIAKAQIEAFEKALDTYRLDVGRYPTTEEGMGALLVKPSGVTAWSGPYLKKAVPLDPWGHAYIYRSPGTKGDFEIVSYGKDGAPGGEGENADVSNQ
jgi:general secretion pathway protein G